MIDWEIVELDFNRGVTPHQALAILPNALSEEVRQRFIRRRLAEGLIRATARRSGYEDSTITRTGDYLPVPRHLWAAPWKADEADFWTLGDVEFRLPRSQTGNAAPILITLDGICDPEDALDPEQYAGGYYLDVRFDAGDVREQFDKLVAPADVPAATNAAGRPPASWWPKFAAELAIYLHEEGLPEGDAQAGQEKVINAILQRLSDRGTEGSRTTMQPVIREVLRRLKNAGN